MTTLATPGQSPPTAAAAGASPPDDDVRRAFARAIERGDLPRAAAIFDDLGARDWHELHGRELVRAREAIADVTRPTTERAAARRLVAEHLAFVRGDFDAARRALPPGAPRDRRARLLEELAALSARTPPGRLAALVEDALTLRGIERHRALDTLLPTLERAAPRTSELDRATRATLRARARGLVLRAARPDIAELADVDVAGAALVAVERATGDDRPDAGPSLEALVDDDIYTDWWLPARELPATVVLTWEQDVEIGFLRFAGRGQGRPDRLDEPIVRLVDARGEVVWRRELASVESRTVRAVDIGDPVVARRLEIEIGTASGYPGLADIDVFTRRPDRRPNLAGFATVATSTRGASLPDADVGERALVDDDLHTEWFVADDALPARIALTWARAVRPRLVVLHGRAFGTSEAVRRGDVAVYGADDGRWLWSTALTGLTSRNAVYVDLPSELPPVSRLVVTWTHGVGENGLAEIVVR